MSGSLYDAIIAIAFAFILGIIVIWGSEIKLFFIKLFKKKDGTIKK